jgi:hypothetical protein
MEEFKRGEVIEVQETHETDWRQRTYVATIEGAAKPFGCVIDQDEGKFRAGEPFLVGLWPHARKRRPDLKVDDRVLVSSTPNSGWLKRHFKRWADDGRIVTFMDGNTSWTEKGFESSWDEYKLPEVPQ